ncbi:unnamed protein product [Lymnaea stagnalis]|uniref:Mab-21-like HhH/H2TH-like domain-containing protein n=1 Tax=Lymnaea stagnalis TaxID=6523 RepID=A0AAV2H2K0_LYMST
MINVPKFDNNKENLIQHIQHIDYVLECTIGFFLKEVDVHLGTAMSHSVNSPEGRTRLPSSPSSNSISSLTSPRLPRRVINPPRQSPQSLPSQMPVTKNDDSYAKSWIQFEKFKACLGWVFPEVNFDGANIGQVSQGDQKLSLILQFLYQNCPIRPLQWNVATSVVSYSLYILDHQLKAINADLSDLLTFCRFESIGSATEGTLVGAANRFDALFLIDISKLTEMTILHNNFCSDIPAGHVILGVKDGSSPACQNFKYIKKACVQNLFGFYLVPQEVEEYVEALLKKAILKLYRESKSKMDRLPFSFQLSPTKKLNLTIDTRLMQGLGLGLSEINIRFIPALSLSVVDFSMLPPIYAVPTWGSGTNHEAKGNTLPKTVLSRIFRDQSNNDLLWNICTDKLNSTVIKNFEKRLNLSGVRGHHKECLMILKALFSQSTKNTLLNKGEIDATVLSTVISFLLQESSASAWTLESLADRVSDSIHFLKSCFENILLPNFSVHNPHLLEQIPCLEMLTPLLSGRQQNILSHVSNDAALKVLGYIEQRLQETGLRKCVKQEFSANMWEYEFFIFG